MFACLWCSVVVDAAVVVRFTVGYCVCVVVSLAVAVFNSPVFKRFLGKDSEFFVALRKVFMVSYRHSLYESAIRPSTNAEEDYSGTHRSYVGENSTRFFTPTEPYER